MNFLSEVEKKLDLPPGEKAEVLKELESHYREVEHELTAAGMDEHEVAAEAGRRLGDPQDVASRLQTVHCQATKRTAWLTVLPFLGLILGLPVGLLMDKHTKVVNPILLFPFGVVMAAFAAIMIVGSVRELRAGRRPVWLATWLAVGVTLLTSAIRLFASGLFIHAEPTDFYYRVSTTGIYLLVFAPLAMWASKGSIRCVVFVAGLLAFVIAFAARNMWIPIGQQMVWGVLCVGLAPLVLLILIALRLFSFHPYGTVGYASLFLFTISANVSFLSAPALAEPVAVVLTGAVTWIAVRASSKQRKQSILSWGLFIIGVSRALVSGWAATAGNPEYHHIAEWMAACVFLGAFNYIWVIVIPKFVTGWVSAGVPENRLTIEQ